MIEFKRNKETGIVEVWKNGKKVGEIITMGDEIIDGGIRSDRQHQRNQKRERASAGKSR